MSEPMNPSEPTVEPEQPATPPSEPATPPGKPMKNKKSLWLMIVAIIVAVLLIATAVYVLFLPDEEGGAKELDATIDPDPASVAAGRTLTLSAVVTLDDEDPEAGDDLSYRWSVSPLGIGTFDLTGRFMTNFTAGDTAATGTITCVVTYEFEDEESTVSPSVDLTITPPTFASVAVVPSDWTIQVGTSKLFTATAFDSVGGTMTGATFDWEVAGMAESSYELDATTGSTVNMTGVEDDAGWLNVTGTIGSTSHSGSATVEISSTAATRTVDSTWYDMFNVPFGEWWTIRADVYGEDVPLTDEYPYLFTWYDVNRPGNDWIYTMMRLNIDARNITNVNMTENPLFFPLLGTERGGVAEIDWYMQYATNEDLEPYPGILAQNEGWIVMLTGTLTLDEQAAKAVMGIDDDGLADFDTWWDTYGTDVQDGFDEYMDYEGNERLDIWCMYEYPLAPFHFELQAEMVGDEVVLSYTQLSWGMEALMSRWLRDAFMKENEWYFEDFSMHTIIDSQSADFDIDTAVNYAMYAYVAAEPAFAGDPIWMWESLKGDYVYSQAGHPSEMDPYWDMIYLNLAPGSTYYDEWMDYDYTPGWWNLSEGETLTFEWPAGDQLFFTHIDVGEQGESTGPMTVTYAEPDDTDFPDQIEIDTEARTITYTGGGELADMWTWSKDQTNPLHEGLADEWDRLRTDSGGLDLLPYGMPTVEFRMTGPPEPSSYRIENVSDPIDRGVADSFDVVVLDQYGSLYPDYEGTITFSSSDMAADLPDDYTFQLSDGGMKSFDVTFNTIGEQWLYGEDADDATIFGSQDDITVETPPEPPRADHFVVSGVDDPIIAGNTTSVTVMVYDQYDNLFPSYDGTVEFDCAGDPGATLPTDYTFVPATDQGEVTLDGIVFATAGEQNLTVTDQSNSSLLGWQDEITVLPAREMHSFGLVVSPVRPQVDVACTVTVTAYDQYGWVFPGYDGTAVFDTNRSGEAVLPADYTFDPGVDEGVHVYTSELTFTEVGWFNLGVSDEATPTILGWRDVEVVLVADEIDHFVVSEITDMLAGNWSDVKVEAYSQNGLFTDYVGMIDFTTDATEGEYTLPASYTFVSGDNGVKVFTDGVSFATAGTYWVTVTDSVVGTATGTQSDIVILPNDATTLVLDAPASVGNGAPFDVTVTILNQYDETYLFYDGIVQLESSDPSAVLPAAHEFDPETDMGVYTFVGLEMSTEGTQKLWANDTVDVALTDEASIQVPSAIGPPSLTYTAYDFFEDPLGEFWTASGWGRIDYYGDTAILDNDPGEVSYLYANWAYSSPTGTQAMIYAPYRWSIMGENLTVIDISSPEFMYVPDWADDVEPGAEVNLSIYMQYLNNEWWDDYWDPVWGDDPDFNSLPPWDHGPGDGYFTGIVYEVTMNREAAVGWLGMPSDEADPVAWYGDGDWYESEWSNWIEYEGQERLDIFNGYEMGYETYGMMSSLTEELNGDLTLTIATSSWGYEIIITRWLNETGICTHEPWYEDLHIYANYTEGLTPDFYLDGVAQWGLHATRANESGELDTDTTWTWEAVKIDYMYNTQHPSDWAPYVDLEYQSWNSGDNFYGTDVGYETTPGELDLGPNDKLIFILPDMDTEIVGWLAEGSTLADVEDACLSGDTTYFDTLRTSGAISLGWYLTNPVGGVNLDALYSPVAGPGGNTLEISGLQDFDNVRWPSGCLYHGAPWIEFNVTPLPKAMAASSALVVEEGSAAAAPTASAELLSLTVVASAAILAVSALAVGVRRVNRA